MKPGDDAIQRIRRLNDAVGITVRTGGKRRDAFIAEKLKLDIEYVRQILIEHKNEQKALEEQLKNHRHNATAA